MASRMESVLSLVLTALLVMFCQAGPYCTPKTGATTKPLPDLDFGAFTVEYRVRNSHGSGPCVCVCVTVVEAARLNLEKCHLFLCAYLFLPLFPSLSSSRLLSLSPRLSHSP